MEVLGPEGIWGQVQGVSSENWGSRSLFPDWPGLGEDHIEGHCSAHSCSNFGGKIQNGVHAKS